MKLRQLCETHTCLNENDIIQLEKVEEQLQLMADLSGGDIFIDVMTREAGVAVVVAEAKPSQGKSNYQRSVVGELAYRHHEPAAIRTLEIGMPTRDLRAITQEEQRVRQHVVPIFNEANETIGCLIMENDISQAEKENAQMKMLTETTEQLTETLVDTLQEDILLQPYLNDGIVVFNGKGISQKMNPVATRMYRHLGYQEELVGIPFDNLALDGSQFKELAETIHLKTSEVKRGDMMMEVKYAPLSDEKDQFSGLLMIVKDITEEKNIERKLITKSVAMKEIHHRVKNNLQTIASLLRLQSRRTDSQKAKRALEDSISRVISISATHEILAQSGVDEVDLRTIIERAVSNTFGSLEEDCEISLKITGSRFQVSSDLATTVALIVNELVQNSMKYAFQDREKGLIEINIEKGIMYSSVVVRDDGLGFDAETSTAGSLGLSIVKSMVEEKLKGRFTLVSTEGGTKAMFDFKMTSE